MRLVTVGDRAHCRSTRAEQARAGRVGLVDIGVAVSPAVRSLVFLAYAIAGRVTISRLNMMRSGFQVAHDGFRGWCPSPSESYRRRMLTKAFQRKAVITSRSKIRSECRRRRNSSGRAARPPLYRVAGRRALIAFITMSETTLGGGALRPCILRNLATRRTTAR